MKLETRDIEFITRLLGHHTCPNDDNPDSVYVQRLYERLADYCERVGIDCEGPLTVSVTEREHDGRPMFRVRRIW